MFNAYLFNITIETLKVSLITAFNRHGYAVYIYDYLILLLIFL